MASNTNSIFGQASASTNSPFGSTSGNKPAFSFGAPAAGDNPAATGGLFGGAGAGGAKPFSFGASSNSTTSSGGLFGAKPADSTAKPAFGFGSTPADSSSNPPGGKPFSFGASSTSTATPAFGAQVSTNSTGGLFGAKPADSGAAKPAFSFGASKPAESSTSTEAPKPFSFGAPAGDKPAATGGLFGGAASTSDKPAAPSGGLFGSAAPASDKPTASSGGLFGGAAAASKSAATGGLFGGASSAAPAPAAGGLFGAPKANDATSTTSSPIGGLFGAAKPAESTGGLFGAAAKPAASTGGLFGSTATTEKKEETKAPSTFSFGAAKPAEEKKNDTAKPAFSFGASKPAEQKKDDAAKPAGFSFGAAKPAEEKKEETKAPAFSFGAAKPAEEKKDAAAKPAGFSFGASKTEEKKDSAVKPAGFSFGAKPEVKKESAAATTPAADPKKTVSFSASVISKDNAKEVAKTAEPQPVTLNNKTLEDLITKWTTQLTSASSSFEAYAGKINEWDNALIDGSERISQLYKDVQEADATQGKIDQALLYIERQQNELETFLDNYESKVQGLLSDVLNDSQTQRSTAVMTNDEKRAQAYHTVELLDENLNLLGSNFGCLITEINEVSEAFNKANGVSRDTGKEGLSEDSVKLMNTYLKAMQHIDKESAELAEMLDKVKGINL